MKSGPFSSGRFRAPRLAALTILCLLVMLSTGRAQIVVQDVGRAPTTDGTRIVLPYAFFSETFDTSVGVFGVWPRYPQEQSTLYATAFGSVNGSWRAWIGAYDLRVRGFRRLFLSPDLMGTSYHDVKVYIDGATGFAGVRAGAHGSDAEDHVTAPGWDGGAKLSFRYVLPLGHGREHVVNRVSVDSGVLVSQPVGARSWNPLHSGRTSVMVEPFFRNQELELEEGTRTLRSNGLRLELKHDNTDFVLNPSRGDIKSVAVTRDWGWLESSDSWTHLEAEYRRFVDLGETPRHRQRVLAFDVWVSDVPTWETEVEDGVSRVSRRPPYFDGSTLGGFYRLRAYPVNRFSDRSAVYYSAELRAMPRWNPLEGIAVFGTPGVEWWQWVLFCEAGRVAERFDVGSLHSDMNWDAGLGLRLYSDGLLGRIDVAAAEEGWSMVAMVGHSF